MYQLYKSKNLVLKLLFQTVLNVLSKSRFTFHCFKIAYRSMKQVRCVRMKTTLKANDICQWEKCNFLCVPNSKVEQDWQYMCRRLLVSRNHGFSLSQVNILQSRLSTWIVKMNEKYKFISRQIREIFCLD